MAKAKRKAAKRRSRSRASSRQQGAIELLKADHRQVLEWFGQFKSTRSQDRKQKLAQQCCQALKVHTQIEQEIFYPAFLEATGAKDVHHEAEVEHAGATKLIEEIEAAGPGDEYFDARVNVLSEMIRHHVNEEEKRDGMFAKARQSEMDLVAVGEQLAMRKSELMSGMQMQGSGSRRQRRSPATSHPAH